MTPINYAGVYLACISRLLNSRQRIILIFTTIILMQARRRNFFFLQLLRRLDRSHLANEQRTCRNTRVSYIAHELSFDVPPGAALRRNRGRARIERFIRIRFDVIYLPSNNNERSRSLFVRYANTQLYNIVYNYLYLTSYI